MATKGSASPARTCEAGIRVVLSRGKGARTCIPMPACQWLQTALGRGTARERWLSSASNSPRSWRASSLFTVRNWVACHSIHSNRQRLELGKKQESPSAPSAFLFSVSSPRHLSLRRSTHGHGHFRTCVLPAQLSLWFQPKSSIGLLLAQIGDYSLANIVIIGIALELL